MADVEARREARRRKILQNSEKRMNILYGRNDQDKNDTSDNSTDRLRSEEVLDNRKCKDNDQEKSSLKDVEETTPELETLPTCDNIKIGTKDQDSATYTTSSSDRLHSHPTESDGVRHRQTRNTVKLQQSSQSSLADNRGLDPGLQTVDNSPPPGTSPQWSPQQKFDLLRIVSCVFIAILSRVVLQLGIGLLYFQTIVLPFTVLQIALFYIRNTYFKNVVLAHKGSAMASALMLCGIKPQLIATYNNIMGSVTAVYEDFFIYLFAFFVSNMLIRQEVY